MIEKKNQNKKSFDKILKVEVCGVGTVTRKNKKNDKKNFKPTTQ